MGFIITIIIYIVLFAIGAYAMQYVCQRFNMPQPVLWLCGALLLIIILLFLAHVAGLSLNLGALK